MRIVAGEQRGRALSAPKGMATRPTADRVRQAIFDVIEHAAWAPRLRGARVLDLFAGSGALGLECLSRGAERCEFVDHAPAALQAIKANIATLRLEARCTVRRADATLWRPLDAQRCAFAFMDPPYGKGLISPTLAALLAADALTTDAIAVVEQSPDDPEPDAPGYDLIDTRRWGPAVVRFLRRSG